MKPYQLVLRKPFTLLAPVLLALLTGVCGAAVAHGERSLPATGIHRCPPGYAWTCTNEGPGGSKICFCEPFSP
jgi:hypothetical protein